MRNFPSTDFYMAKMKGRRDGKPSCRGLLPQVSGSSHSVLKFNLSSANAHDASQPHF
jgi:hypothetical protein